MQGPSSFTIVKTQLVEVSGPPGTVNGIFVYQPGTTPGLGNGPILSGTEATADRFGNAVQQGWVAYSSPGSATWAALAAGQVTLNAPGSFSPGSLTEPTAGQMQISSGQQSLTDSGAIVVLLSRSANDGIHRIIELAADQVQLPVEVVATSSGTLTIDNSLALTGTSISAPNATAINFDVATIDVANGNVNLNMADPPNTAAVIAGTVTEAQYNACLGGMLNSMKNRKLFA